MKLYEVNVEFTYYVLAENTREAESYADDAWQDGDREALAQEISTETPPSWPGDALVYGGTHGTTLDQALAAQGLPSVAGISRLFKARVFRS